MNLLLWKQYRLASSPTQSTVVHAEAAAAATQVQCTPDHQQLQGCCRWQLLSALGGRHGSIHITSWCVGEWRGFCCGFCCGFISKPTTAGSGHFNHLHHSKYIYLLSFDRHFARYKLLCKSVVTFTATDCVHFPWRSHANSTSAHYTMYTCTSPLGNSGAQPGSSPL